MSRALLNVFKQSTARLSTHGQQLSAHALNGFRAQASVGGSNAYSGIFSDWSQEPHAQTLVPFVVEQSVGQPFPLSVGSLDQTLDCEICHV